MPQMTDVAVPLCRLSPGDGQFFLGYYDLPAADAQGASVPHVPSATVPTPDDEATIGWLKLPAGDDSPEPQFAPSARPVAWNFQQGSMLQWLPQPDTCLYNTFADGHFGCCIHNVATASSANCPCRWPMCRRTARRPLRQHAAHLRLPPAMLRGTAGRLRQRRRARNDGVSVLDLATGQHRKCCQ